MVICNIKIYLVGAQGLAPLPTPISKSIQSRIFLNSFVVKIFISLGLFITMAATPNFMVLKAIASDLPSPIVATTAQAIALPPPDDIPEEIARTEIITEARSSLDGSPVTAAEYAEQQASLRTAPYPPDAPQRFRDLVLLLQFRRLLRPFLP